MEFRKKNIWSLLLPSWLLPRIALFLFPQLWVAFPEGAGILSVALIYPAVQRMEWHLEFVVFSLLAGKFFALSQ